MKKDKLIDIQEMEACPGDELMKLYRRNPEELRKNVFFSKTSIKFFKSMADIVVEDKRIITFFWNSIPEEELPSLKIKVQKEKEKYRLLYLKEKVNYEERKNEFKGRLTLNINQSNLRKLSKGNVIINKKEMER
jgi:hypothetical protein